LFLELVLYVKSLPAITFVYVFLVHRNAETVS
jgi:hypothetical protein